MEYIIILLEGIITFISPCMLPMLPIYISYFAGQEVDEKNTLKKLANVIGFVLGFTIIFTVLGVFSASLGILLKNNMKIVNIVLGIIVFMFGLSFMGVININKIYKGKGVRVKNENMRFLSSVLFGIIKYTSNNIGKK